ncbi:hypothetical protein WJX75_008974 [Coccomyxa subellipsoidea]|uniref:CHCH domain-containing protein n=1 Tax=Coccomyxa subellipsoidea TaxID=248742 RepID=A0ABR2Z549_9CHLO
MSISKHLAARCSKQSKAFIECKRKDKNPEACLKEGDAVTACAIETLKLAQEKAPQEFKAFYECMDYYSNKFEKCRKEQKAFEAAFPVS